MTKQLTLAVDLWYEIATLLNNIVKEEGEISIDDKRIWDGYLHRWTNEEWMLIVQAVYELNQDHPELFKRYHVDALEATILALSAGHQNSRIMDKRKNKGTEWRMIMTLREVWNNANAIHLPNQPSTTNKTKIRQANQFNSLFDLDAYAGAQ